MAIFRRPPLPDAPPPAAAIDQFISGAPDSGLKKVAPVKPVAGIRRGNKQQISVTFHPELLVKMDEMASETGQSRAALINMAVYELLNEWVSRKYKGSKKDDS